MRKGMLSIAAVLMLGSLQAQAAPASAEKVNGAGFASPTSVIRRAAARTKLGAQSLLMRTQTRFLRWTPTYKVALANGSTNQVQTPGIKQDRERIIKVSNLGESGIANVFGAVPVSAHVMLKKFGARPLSKVLEWARTDKFQIELESPTGDKTRILKDAQSTGLVTPVEFNLKLNAGRNVLTYWRNGSAGVAGARGSRTIVLDYDGT